MAIPFAFFGAGDAGYYEQASLTVVFRKAPSAAQRRRIEQEIPKPLRPSRWTRRALLLATDDHALTRTRSFTRFNAAIERWLHACHAIAPIDFALRAPDDEGGGTQFSAWHHDSLAGALALLTKLGRRYDDAETRDHVKETLLEMLREADIAIPAELTPAPRPAADAPLDAARYRAALLDDSAGAERVRERFLAVAGEHAFWATMCAAKAAEVVEDVPETAFAALDRLVELATAHPVVIENALWAVEKVGPTAVARERLERYWSLAVAKLPAWAALRPYLTRLAPVLGREPPTAAAIPSRRRGRHDR